MKSTKENARWIEEQKKQGKNDSEIEELLEKRIMDGMNSLYEKFSAKSSLYYDKERIFYELEKKGGKDNSKLTSDQMIKLYEQISEKELTYYRVQNLEKKDKSISFSIVHESFEIEKFRDQIIPSYSSWYLQVSMEISSPYALITIDGNPLYFGSLRALLKEYIDRALSINSVKWEDSSLREIMSNYADTTIIISAKGIEGDITAKATSTNLNNKNMLVEIENGYITSVKFTFKTIYPGNDIYINGVYGYITTSLSEDDSRKFIKNHLLIFST